MKRALLAVAAGLAVPVVFAVTPAAATVPCSAPGITDTADWKNLGPDDKTVTEGTFTLTADGVRLKTPGTGDKVYYYLSLPNVPMANVTKAGFNNTKHGAGGTQIPAFQFGFDADGDGDWDATLSWEQPYQPSAMTNPADVLHSGTALWRITRAVSPVAKDATKTWNDWKTVFPNAKFLYWGINQGTGNPGSDNTVNGLTLWYGQTHLFKFWHQRCASASPSPSGSHSASPSTSKSANVATLPVTGSNVPYIVGAGITAVVLGGLLTFLAWRRRKTEFVSE